MYILLFTSLGFFLGYKWYEKKAKQIEEDEESDDEDYSDSEEEDENPGIICTLDDNP